MYIFIFTYLFFPPEVCKRKLPQAPAPTLLCKTPTACFQVQRKRYLVSARADLVGCPTLRTSCSLIPSFQAPFSGPLLY